MIIRGNLFGFRALFARVGRNPIQIGRGQFVGTRNGDIVKEVDLLLFLRSLRFLGDLRRGFIGGRFRKIFDRWIGGDVLFPNRGDDVINRLIGEEINMFRFMCFRRLSVGREIIELFGGRLGVGDLIRSRFGGGPRRIGGPAVLFGISEKFNCVGRFRNLGGRDGIRVGRVFARGEPEHLLFVYPVLDGSGFRRNRFGGEDG